MPATRTISYLLAIGGLSVLVACAQADSRPSAPSPDLDALPPNAQRIYRDTTLFPRQAKWLDIPWMADMNKAVQAARQENRPLLLWVSGDDPLERC